MTSLAALERERLAPESRARRSAAAWQITRFESLESAASFWRAFERHAAAHVFQTHDWLSCWHRTAGEKEDITPHLLLVEDRIGRPLMLLPFGLARAGHLKKIVWLGGDTADYMGPLVLPDWHARLGGASFESLWQEIRAALPEHDLIELLKQPAALPAPDGTPVPNPFAALDVTLHPSGTHMTRLGADWESYYKSKRSASTRKRDRNRRNALSRQGALAFETPQTEKDIDASLDALIEQKNAFFAACGIHSFLKKPGYRDFYREMAKAHGASGLIDVCHLRAGDEIAATNWGARFRGRYYYVLGGFTTSSFLAKQSPGSLFLLDLMKRTAEAGDTPLFDFSIGDEPYKDDWCEIHEPLYDLRTAGSLTGLLALLPMRLAAKAKRTIKQSPRLWALAQKLRRLRG